jgi:hypothetical protein
MKIVEVTTQTVEVEDIVGFKCDCCGIVYNPKADCMTDQLEIQEMWMMHQLCGYGSVFGDGIRLECDLCQHCVKKLLGDYIREYDESPI